MPYEPVGSISTQMHQQRMKKMKLSKPKLGVKVGIKAPIQNLARKVADQSMGAVYPKRFPPRRGR